jgi:hypothetical protein
MNINKLNKLKRIKEFNKELKKIKLLINNKTRIVDNLGIKFKKAYLKNNKFIIQCKKIQKIILNFLLISNKKT